MAHTAGMTKADSSLRLAIYRFAVRKGHLPTTRELARVLSQPEASVRAGFRRLAGAHVLVLQTDSPEILRAAPFWGVPTTFRVQSGNRSWWGSCIWDALGIPAMLHRDAQIITACGCCDSTMTLTVEGGRLAKAKGIMHIAVPASRWYENIVFT
jgi:hypothetical protein